MSFARRTNMWLEKEKLNLETKGTETGAPPILLIHGAGGGAVLWEEVTNLLAPDFKVAALDLSGHGGSPDRENYREPDTYVEDALAAMRALGAPPVLCGHSMGGAVAMLAALRSPESVRALALVGTGARLRVLPAIFESLKADFPAAVRNMCGFSFTKQAHKEQARILEEAMLKAGRETTIRDFTLCDNFDIMREAGKISQPTLVVCGEKDVMTPPKYSMWLAENIPGAKLTLIPDCGHLCMMEAPGETAAAIREVFGFF